MGSLGGNLAFLCLLISHPTTKAHAGLPEAPSFTDDIDTSPFFTKLVRINCPVTGNPFPMIQWFYDDKPLNLSNFHLLNNGTQIVSTSKTAMPQGAFKCVASNTHGTIFSPDVRTVESHMPFMTALAYNVSAVTGESLMLKCASVPSVPAVRYDWKVDDEYVMLDDRRYLDHLGNLHIQSAMVYDSSDNYACYASNRILDLSFRVATRGLYVSEGVLHPSAPTFLSTTPRSSVFHPEKRKVLVGMNVTLSCSFSAFPRPVIHWISGTVSDVKSRVDMLIKYSEHTSTSYIRHYKEAFLRLKKVKVRDSGIYACVAINSKGSDSHYFSLLVESKPFFESPADHPNKSTTAIHDSNITLTCNPSGRPTPTVQWFKNAMPISDIPARYHLSSDMRTLRITRVCKRCAGTVTDVASLLCMATNSHGAAVVSTHLNVLDQTRMSVKPQDQVYDDTTTQLSFRCDGHSDASLPFNITWSRRKDHDRWSKLSDYANQLWISPDQRTLVIGYSLHNLSSEPPSSSASSSSPSLLPSSPALPSSSSQSSSSSSSQLLHFWREFEGLYSCEINNLHSSEKSLFSITATTTRRTFPLGLASLSEPSLLLLVVLLIVLLLLLFLISIIIYTRYIRCRSATYLVDEREKENGNDPLEEMRHDGFKQFSRPNRRISRLSLISAGLSIGSEYNEEECRRYNEDGSFIGDYVLD